MIYSHENVDPKKTFKKTLRDLPRFAQEEKDKKVQQKFNSVMREKQEGLDRYTTRKLERFINQYQSSQGLTDIQIEEIK